MPSYPCITLLTDYGLDDGFVAACHGVIARFVPEVRIIDVTHLVPAGDVRRGGAVLAQTATALPPGVHVAVVDPGVGTARRAIAIEAGDSVLLGPDNGVLSWPVDALGGPRNAYELTNRKLWLHPVSATFHGRDIFTPVAARIAGGLEPGEVGRALPPEELVALPPPVSRVTEGRAGAEAEAEVVTADAFGNVQLSLTAEQLASLGLRSGGQLALDLAGGRVAVPYRETFASVGRGELVAHIDSAGLLAVAVNGGNAQHRLGVHPGTVLRLSAGPPRRPDAGPGTA